MNQLPTVAAATPTQPDQHNSAAPCSQHVGVENSAGAATYVPPTNWEDAETVTCAVTPVAPPRRQFEFQMVELSADGPLVLRATNKRVHVGWDPRHINHAQAADLFRLCAESAGVDVEGVEFPTLQQLADAAELSRIVMESPDPAGLAARVLARIDAEKTPPAYVPPTDWDHAESITLAGERGTFLKACLYTPSWQGIPEGPTCLSVWSEDSSEGDLDLAGARQFRADVAALVPKLDAMIGVLAAQDSPQQVQPETTAATLVASAESAVMAAVKQSLTGLKTNPHDVSKRLHRSIDNVQGWHLAEVGGHDETDAYAESRYSSAIDAMADALKATSNPGRMAVALRSALDMAIREAQ